MARSIRSYQREIQHLKSLLSDAEWVQPTYNGSPSCAFCGNQQHWNHRTDCPLPKECRDGIDYAAHESANEDDPCVHCGSRIHTTDEHEDNRVYAPAKA